MTGLAALMQWSETGLWHGALVLFRIGAFMALVPGLSEQSVPTRIKLGLAVALTVVVAPALPPFQTDAWDIPSFFYVLMAETVNGLLLGVVLRLMVIALQTAGTIAAQSSSLSQIAGGAAAEPLPAIGHILVVGALALAMAMGFHTKLALFLIDSYRYLPHGQFPNPSDLYRLGLENVAKSFAFAFTLAAPFVILSMIYNLALGVINKAMPQLMVAFVGAPVITFGGLAILYLLAPTLLTVWIKSFSGLLAMPLGAPG